MTRDITKSSILRKAKIPQVAIRTNEELEAIRNAILQIVRPYPFAIKTEEEPWETWEN